MAAVLCKPWLAGFISVFSLQNVQQQKLWVNMTPDFIGQVPFLLPNQHPHPALQENFLTEQSNEKNHHLLKWDSRFPLVFFLQCSKNKSFVTDFYGPDALPAELINQSTVICATFKYDEPLYNIFHLGSSYLNVALTTTHHLYSVDTQIWITTLKH